MAAAADGSGGVVAILLKAGADVHKADAEGCDAFQLCCLNDDGHIGDALALLEAGAKFDKWMGPQGQSPLHLAALWNHEKLVRMMVEKGADVEVKDATGETPMHRMAVQSDLAPVLFDLVAQNKRRATMRDADGRTPLGVACGPCRRAIERALFFLGRYELVSDTPKHRSATCVILFAVDHGEEDDDPPPAAGAATKKEDAPATAAPPAAEAAKGAAAAPGGPKPPAVANSTAGKAAKPSGKGASSAAAPPAAPAPPPPPRRLRDVALKIMHNKEQFEREVAVRKSGGGSSALDPAFVLPVLRTHELSPDDAKSLGGEYFYCLVMERAQEDLAGAIAHSRMSFEAARAVAAAVGRCVEHIHDAARGSGGVPACCVHSSSMLALLQTWLLSLPAICLCSREAGSEQRSALKAWFLSFFAQGLLHSDLKPLNVVRTSDGQWKLIDLVRGRLRFRSYPLLPFRTGVFRLWRVSWRRAPFFLSLLIQDAAAILKPQPGNAGAKTSSAYSPPELFYK